MAERDWKLEYETAKARADHAEREAVLLRAELRDRIEELNELSKTTPAEDADRLQVENSRLRYRADAAIVERDNWKDEAEALADIHADDERENETLRVLAGELAAEVREHHRCGGTGGGQSLCSVCRLLARFDRATKSGTPGR